VFCLGDTFLEVVSPVQENTAAARLMDRRGGDCGYTTMFRLDDLGGGARARSLGGRARGVPGVARRHPGGPPPSCGHARCDRVAQSGHPSAGKALGQAGIGGAKRTSWRSAYAGSDDSFGGPGAGQRAIAPATDQASVGAGAKRSLRHERSRPPSVGPIHAAAQPLDAGVLGDGSVRSQRSRRAVSAGGRRRAQPVGALP
jgi:hypothetical protein